MFLKRHQLREFGRTLVELHELERISPGAYVEDISTVKAELQQFEAERYKGALVRARSHRFLDEQPTRRALSDERQTALAKEILQIEYDGCPCRDAPGIVDAFLDYFRKLFGRCGDTNGRAGAIFSNVRYSQFHFAPVTLVTVVAASFKRLCKAASALARWRASLTILSRSFILFVLFALKAAGMLPYHFAWLRSLKINLVASRIAKEMIKQRAGGFSVNKTKSTKLLGNMVRLARQRPNAEATSHGRLKHPATTATSARGAKWNWECGTLENIALDFSSILGPVAVTPLVRRQL